MMLYHTIRAKRHATVIRLNGVRTYLRLRKTRANHSARFDFFCHLRHDRRNVGGLGLVSRTVKTFDTAIVIDKFEVFVAEIVGTNAPLVMCSTFSPSPARR